MITCVGARERTPGMALGSGGGVDSQAAASDALLEAVGVFEEAAVWTPRQAASDTCARR
jgi:ribosomal protein S12 methylthiotransferase accessory factor YcaO